MLDTAGLDASSLCFEKDWDLSCKYKLDWQLRQLQNPWQAFEDLRELGDVCQLEEPESVSDLLCKLGGIAFNLDGEHYKHIYPPTKTMYLEQLRLQVRKPADLFGWLELYLDPLVEDLDSAFAEFSPQERKIDQHGCGVRERRRDSIKTIDSRIATVELDQRPCEAREKLDHANWTNLHGSALRAVLNTLQPGLCKSPGLQAVTF